jgi:hypothetical protein
LNIANDSDSLTLVIEDGGTTVVVGETVGRERKANAGLHTGSHRVVLYKESAEEDYSSVVVATTRLIL